MKKLLCLICVFLFVALMPLSAFADAAAPEQKPEDVFAGENGLRVTVETDAETKEYFLEFGTPVTVEAWYTVSFVTEDGEYLIGEANVSDLLGSLNADKPVRPNKLSARTIRRAAAAVTSEDALLRYGPGENFPAVIGLPEEQKLTLEALYDDTWAYASCRVAGETLTGWINLDATDFAAEDAQISDGSQSVWSLLFPTLPSQALPVLLICIAGALMLSAACVVTVLLIRRARKRKQK